jgi:hypothetical protein
MPFSERIAIIKAKMDNDVFTTQPEAAARSMDMGFGGATHVTQDEMGQAFYMPGESHEDYINYYSTSEIEEPEGEDDSPSDDSPSDDSMEEGAMKLLSALSYKKSSRLRRQKENP